MNRYPPGFSLMELMMVVAIISILSVLALPSYQTYTKRARFAEVVAATQPFKLAIAIALQTGANARELNSGVRGIPATPLPTDNLAAVTVKHGVITATSTHLLDNTTYILKPNEEGSHWTVAGTCLESGWCRG